MDVILAGGNQSNWEKDKISLKYQIGENSLALAEDTLREAEGRQMQLWYYGDVPGYN